MSKRIFWIKVVLFIVLLIPFFAMLIAAVKNRLGPDPAEALAHMTGEWALHCLLLTLALSSLSRWHPRWRFILYRRMCGLFSFFYAVLHLLVYTVFLLGLQWRELLIDISERPYITVGFAALVLMTPLAITSNRYSIGRLGKYWQVIHQLIYPVALLVLIHIWWQLRSDAGGAVAYTACVLVLMTERVYTMIRRRVSS